MAKKIDTNVKLPTESAAELAEKHARAAKLISTIELSSDGRSLVRRKPELLPDYVDKVLMEKPKPVLAVKYDTGKPDYTLLPKPALDAACRALMYGEQKYERFNYLKGAGLAQHRVLASVFRHLYAHNAGELSDSESGLAHTDHAVAALMMLIDLIAAGKGLS